MEILNWLKIEYGWIILFVITCIIIFSGFKTDFENNGCIAVILMIFIPSIIIDGFIYLIWHFPWLLLIIFLGFLLISVLWVSLTDINCFSRRNQNWFIIIFLKIINPIRKLFGKHLIWLIPEIKITGTSGDDIILEANHLVSLIHDEIQNNPISIEKKSSIRQMSEQVPENITKALWKLARMVNIRDGLSKISDPQSLRRSEMDTMIIQLFGEVKHSLEILSSLPVSLAGVDLDHTNLKTDELLSDLNKSNDRLRELSSTYKEARGV